jgi:hypothetical protein
LHSRKANEHDARMDFIFMLTRQDRTIPGCLDVLAQIAPLGLSHIGFKDIGADEFTLRALNTGIKALGAQSYLEVVATSPEAALRSARIAASIGVDHLLGGTQAPEILHLLQGTGVKYYPFPGTPTGHPTQLGGSPEQIAAHTADFIVQGCAGVDLLAYRATQADPLALVAAARAACGSAKLICAGGVDCPDRIAALRAAGADAFTIGSAAFDGSFAPNKPGLIAQLQDIIACV